MATRISVVQNDNNIKLIFNIKKDSRIESLLGATVYLQFKERQTGTTLKRECVITDATMAECMYVLTSEDTAMSGGYVSEIQILYANGTKLTYQNPIILVVTPEIVTS